MANIVEKTLRNANRFVIKKPMSNFELGSVVSSSDYVDTLNELMNWIKDYKDRNEDE